MTLQRRLTLFFVLIVIFPLVAAWLIVQSVIAGEISRRAVLSLRPALDATVALYNNQTSTLERRVSDIGSDVEFARLLEQGNRERIDRFLTDEIRNAQNLDFVVAVDDQGRVVGSGKRPSTFLFGFQPPDTSTLVEAPAGVGPGFARSPEVPLIEESGTPVGRLVGGFWLDEDLLIAASRSGVELSIVVDDLIIATTADLSATRTIEIDPDEAFEADIEEESEAEAIPIGRDVSVVASTPSGPIGTTSGRIILLMLAVFLAALVATSMLAYWLARWITQPLEELARGAEEVAEGRFDRQIAVRSGDEVGQLASAFNHMTERLQDTITQLSSSRDQLQRAVRRVGETLRSTNDMNQMLGSILNSAVDAVDGDYGVLWTFTATRDELYPVSTRNLDADNLGRIKVGHGVVGFVAERSQNVVLPAGEGAPRPARSEPNLPILIAVPLYSQELLRGVLVVYRAASARSFTGEDVDMVSFLAQQGGVAIENVLLHEEAQRLSITDGLTGVWNRRYFQMQSRQILATAQRFNRPFSILMLDLDHFKDVNDTFGHQRGDEVLIEFSNRVTSTLREVDTFARYGGEEFVVMLPETDTKGGRATADKILEAIRSRPFEGGDEPSVSITVSIGIASYPQHGDNIRSLVEAADQALYQAKAQGRNRVCVAGDRTSGLQAVP